MTLQKPMSDERKDSVYGTQIGCANAAMFLDKLCITVPFNRFLYHFMEWL
jgi:hypothetical protein